MSDRYDVTFVQGQRFTRHLRYELNGTPLAVPTPIRWQVREQQSTTAPLIKDLAQYVTTSLGSIDIDIPAAVVSTITRPGFHDMFAGDLMIFRGRTSVDPAVSA